MNKTLKLAFVVSIALNVLFAGVLLGQLPRRFEGRRAPQERLAAVVEKLREPQRSQVQAKLDRMHKEIEPLRADIEKTRNETIAAFIAEPFDESAYDRNVNRIGELRREMGKRLASDMKEIARELSPDQRKALAEAFDRSGRRS